MNLIQIGVIFGLLAAAMCPAWWLLPIMQRNKVKEKAPEINGLELLKLEDEYRKTLTSAFGGLFVVATLMLTSFQIYVSRVSSLEQTSRESENTNTQIRAHEIEKGFDLIGEERPIGRIGGIRMLEEWAEEQVPGSTVEKRYDYIIPALIGLVRQQTHNEPGSQSCETFVRPKSKRIEEDVRAALIVIGKWTHMTSHDSLRLDHLNLSEADLSNFNLDHTDLSFSDLSGVRISDSSFRGSNLYCANMYAIDVKNADFSSTDDTETDLAGALISEAHFNSVNFTNTNLRSANLSDSGFGKVIFNKSDLYNTDFYRTTIGDSTFQATKVEEACFVQTTFSNSNLNDALPDGATLVTPPGEEPGHPTSHCFGPQENGIYVQSSSGAGGRLGSNSP